MGQLKENLQAILAEKAKIKADELLKGKSIFGVEGTVSEVKSNNDVDHKATEAFHTEDENGKYLDVVTTIDENTLFRTNSRIHTFVDVEDVSEAIELTPDKIISGNNVVGIEGTATSDADAIADNIIEGKTAYVNGEKITGTLAPADRLKTKNANSSIVINDNESKVYYTNAPIETQLVNPGTTVNVGATFDNLAASIGLTADRIIEGNTILGIQGVAKVDIPFEDELEYAECLAISNQILGVIE